MDAKDALRKYQDTEAARIRSYTKNAGVEAPAKYAKGGAVKSKGGTTVNINIGQPQGQQQPNPMAAMALANAMKPKPPPVTLPPPQPPQGPQGGAPGGVGGSPLAGIAGLAGGAGGGLPGMKAGGRALGRATALPMTAGAMSGPGRDQKSDSEAKKEGKAEPSMVMPGKRKA